MRKITNEKRKVLGILKKFSYITFLILMMSSTIAFAGESESSNVDVSQVVTVIISGEGVYGTIQEIIGVLSFLGFAIAVGKMMQIGIMYLMGAAKSKNDAKSALIPWVVGAFICAAFGTIGPWVIGTLMSGSGGSVFDI